MAGLYLTSNDSCRVLGNRSRAVSLTNADASMCYVEPDAD